MKSRLRAIAFAAQRGVAEATRRPLVATAIALSVAASLVAIGLVRVATHNLEQHAERSAAEPQLVVYLDPGVTPARAADVSAALSALEGTLHTSIVSGASAKARLEISMADDAALLADLEDAFFPTSIEVTLRDGLRETAALHPFVERLEAVRGVESVQVVGDWVDRAGTLLTALSAAGQLLLILFAGCAAFVVAALMRLASDRGAEERALLRTLGASPAFRVSPLVLAGVLRGAAGGLIACVALYICFHSVSADVSSALEVSLGAGRVEFLPLRDLAFLVVGGAAVGGLGAAFASRGDAVV